MDTYHIWCDLKPEADAHDFATRLGAYLGMLKDQGLIESYRLTRRKLGLGPKDLGQFHVAIDTRNMTQLDEAFQHVAHATPETDAAHRAVNQLVRNTTFALYRDFPDPLP